MSYDIVDIELTEPLPSRWGDGRSGIALTPAVPFVYRRQAKKIRTGYYVFSALRYLPWLVLSPLVSVWSFLYDGVFVGATRAREMRDVMLVSTFAVFLPAWYLLQGLGNDGLWLAFMLFLASRGIGMHILYGRRVLPAI